MYSLTILSHVLKLLIVAVTLVTVTVVVLFMRMTYCSLVMAFCLMKGKHVY